MNNAVIVSAVRTAVGKAGRGSLTHVRPESMAADCIDEVLKRAQQEMDEDELEKNMRDRDGKANWSKEGKPIFGGRRKTRRRRRSHRRKKTHPRKNSRRRRK